MRKIPLHLCRERKRRVYHFDVNYKADETEFMMAMDAYKRAANKPYPAAKDVLAVAHALGYRKQA